MADDITRRTFTAGLAMTPALTSADTYEFAVIGAGVFGSWISYWLRQAGKRVVFVDAYGPGNSRASSGGESRLIRASYGPDEIYTRWVQRSLTVWEGLSKRSSLPLLHRTGFLRWASKRDPMLSESIRVLKKCGVAYEVLSESELRSRYPQIRFAPGSSGFVEPASGALMARRAVQAVAAEAIQNGAVYLKQRVQPPTISGPLHTLNTASGATIQADVFVFACGPWFPKLFPALLAKKIRPTRQEIFFFGTPAGDSRFAPPNFPGWIDFGDPRIPYGFPDLENRGFKIAFDEHGPEFDPDNGTRLVTAAGIAAARTYVGEQFPALRDAPLVESRVCQYENTSSGDFLIDRHPNSKNVWLVGGGSGHGFKHGPALGEYVTNALLKNAPIDPRFSLATKREVEERTVH